MWVASSDKVESRGRARGKVGACNHMLRMLQMPKGGCFQSCLFQTRFPVKFPHCTVGVLSIEVGGKARFAPHNNHFHEQLSRELRSLAPQRPAPFFLLLEDYVCQVAGVSSDMLPGSDVPRASGPAGRRPGGPAIHLPPGDAGHPGIRATGAPASFRPVDVGRGPCSVLVTSTSTLASLACAHGACVTHEL